jgi:hypothetical protein
MIGAVSVAVSVTKHLTSVPVLDTFIAESRSTRDAFREGTFGRRSEGGACGRICHPLPGGAGQLMAPRSS